MKKSLTINAIRNGKKVSKSLGFINPDAANSIVGGFAQMVNALSNDTFVNAEVVKKMDTSEEEQQGGGATTTQKFAPELTIAFEDYTSGTITHPRGNHSIGDLFAYAFGTDEGEPLPVLINRSDNTFSIDYNGEDPCTIVIHIAPDSTFCAATYQLTYGDEETIVTLYND